MRKWLQSLMTAVLGGAVALAGYYFLAKRTSVLASDPFVHQASWKGQPVNTLATGIDFRNAADKARASVVLIQGQASDQLVNEKRKQQNDNNPMNQFFRNFMDDDMGSLFSFPFGGFNIPPGTGSGVIISPDGYIVTNNHVVDDYDIIDVTLFNDKKYNAQVIGKDPSTDLAVIRIDAQNLPVAMIGNSDEAQVGDWVLAIGNPYDKLRSTVTAGIISAKGRDIDILQGDDNGRTIEEFIQTDAAVNPGNSGGALVDAEGNLIGINTAIYSQTGSYVGYSFAIPSNLMQKVAAGLIKNGNVARVSLGVSMYEVNDEIAQELSLGVKSGLLVEQVEDRSSAQYAGILPNDVIVEVEGQKMKSFDDLKGFLDKAKSGDVINVKVWREGEVKSLDVRLKAKF
ncbi:MAG TPA: trypsin-like peptidase domain-containing protein [Saprospiraceae bacterium]|nr:trypsin-like peptidase domain-containing protein [Saprospiraceae bacterium]HPG07054.1 trypsin-like peptidase domain-containing protein [Saprospiraceae bacterium]HRV86536.1 trypsin-like peptidase domain-containing protein [Saprospiraceae bacterium]